MTAVPEIDSFVARADRAVREGARPIIGADSSPDDIRAAFRHATLIEPRPIGPPVQVEVIVVPEDRLRLWFVGTFAPRLHEQVGRKLGDAGWDFRCPLATEWRDVRRPQPGKPKKVAVKRPLFGTYGFLYPADDARPDWIALDRIDGFGGLTRHSVTKVPLRAPGVDVARFVDLEREGVFDATRSRPPKVKAEDRVKANIRGTWFEGLVQMTMGERVRVLLGMLGSAELSVDDVELVA